ncbi:hypothetical protein FRC12_023651 [Ceratobasidium sp. 428]|nr:hypothetical protein FRC12_023651 [Ceratobasidium sp. 428]
MPISRASSPSQRGPGSKACPIMVDLSDDEEGTEQAPSLPPVHESNNVGHSPDQPPRQLAQGAIGRVVPEEAQRLLAMSVSAALQASALILPFPPRLVRDPISGGVRVLFPLPTQDLNRGPSNVHAHPMQGCRTGVLPSPSPALPAREPVAQGSRVPLPSHTRHLHHCPYNVHARPIRDHERRLAGNMSAAAPAPASVPEPPAAPPLPAPGQLTGVEWQQFRGILRQTHHPRIYVGVFVSSEPVPASTPK